MKITETWLRNNATPTSYGRGEDYVDDVSKLTLQGNTYTAQVYGSDLYHITIETNDFDADCFCSCPYDWGGICKHVVAVGLKIIEGDIRKVDTIKDDVVEQIDFETKSNKETPISSPSTFYEDIFIKTDKTVQAEFLKQLFLKDSTLRAQFQHFISHKQQEIILVDIDDIAEELRETLNELDFDVDDMYAQNRGSRSNYSYYDDDDDLEGVAIEIIEAAITPFQKKALQYLEKGNLLDATRTVLGMYEGIFGVDTPYFEDYHFFDDLETEARTIFLAYLKDFGEQCHKIIKNDELVQQTIDLIILRWKYYYQGETENEWDIQYNLHLFEPLFTGLVTSIGPGEYLLNLLEDYERYSYSTSNLYLYLAKVVRDEELELKILEDFASNSIDLSKKLLEFYFDKNQISEFYRVARQSFNIFPNTMDTFLLGKIKPEIDQTFYIEVLRYFTKERNNMEGFKKLKEFWTAAQITDFIEENRLNSAFYVQMLEVEQRFEDILQVVKTNKDSWGFDKLTLPILNIYPAQMLDIYFERAYRAMGPGAQDRRKYQQVAKNLKPILQIKQLNDKRKGLIKQLKNKYRYLPAFIDEMKKAGF